MLLTMWDLPRSGIGHLSPALAGRCVKKYPHGAELCNNKKQRERISPPGRLAGVSVTQGHDMNPGCCWVHFLLQLCFLFQVLTLCKEIWGKVDQRPCLKSSFYLRITEQHFILKNLGRNSAFILTLTSSEIPTTAEMA